jgi:thiosulfate dehydrogenase [quinone] large subunit
LLAVNPFYELPEGTARDVVTWAFWISFIVLLVLLFIDRGKTFGENIEIEGPPFAHFLFNNTGAGVFWLPIRLFVGLAWLDAGWHKATSAGWLDGGSALAGFWTKAVAIPDEGKPAITYEWYRSFLQLLLDNDAEKWFAYIIVFGEIAVGLGLIFGGLTGIAAFFGSLMNMSFLLAGSASTNPILFTLAVGLMLAWKVAGWYGLDRWLLPLLGTPWKPGAIAGSETKPAPSAGTTG